MKVLVSAAVFAVVGVASTLSAQSSDEINAGIQFNLAPPGARSLGMGGAFLGLADDATAAYTNPAGLTTLTRPEVSLEGRNWQYSSLFTRTGDLTGELLTGSLDDERSGVSFASFVYPRGRWAVAAYTAAVSKFAGSIDNVQDDPILILEGSSLRPVSAHLELDIRSYGLSAAGRFGKLSLGAGLSYHTFQIDSRTERFSIQNRTQATNYQTQIGDDNGVGFNAGLTWKPSDKLSLGATARHTAAFDLETASYFGPATTSPDQIIAVNPARFRIPDVFGVGAAWRPTQAVVVALDVNRVQYSQQTRDLVRIFNTPEDQEPGFADLFAANDATQIHAGIEYVLTSLKTPLAFRAGVWHEPEHRIRYIGPVDPDHDGEAAFFREGESALHVSGGIGAVFGGRVQIDAAVDFSERVTTGSLSGVVRF